MRKFYCLQKNFKKAFILPLIIIVLGAILSILALSQLALNYQNSSLNFSINDYKNTSEYNFLSEILSQEFKNIENFFEKNPNFELENFFDSNINKNKIFLLTSFQERISIGGYKIDNDKENLNYYNFLSNKINEYFKNNLDISYKKKISVADKKIYIKVTVNYLKNASNQPEDLSFNSIKRMWIKVYE